jgi:DNA-binding beta-propeller fold protein YncE
MRTSVIASLSAALLLSSAAFAQPQWQVAQTLHIGGEGRWDYVTVDSQNHHLFVPRTTHTMVLDEQGKVLGDIPGQKGNHGVALVPKVNRGFITDGEGAGAIVVFDLKTYAVLGTLPAMPDADGIIYDAKTDRVLAVSGDGATLMSFSPSIDPKNGKVDKINLGGKPEFLASDGAGKAFINLEDKNLVAEVDIAAGKVLARWPVAPGGQPVGMAIDRASHTIFVGCRNPQRLVAIDTQTGKVTSDVPIGAGVDATLFADGQAFASTADGNLTIASAKDGKLNVQQTLKTAAGARTMGIDTSNHRIFLPTAEMEPAATPGGRPRAKPGTFMILIAQPK